MFHAGKRALSTRMHGEGLGATTMKDQYSSYIRRLEEIRRLSTPTLAGISQAGGYSDRLRENFVKIGSLAAENRAFLRSVLMPALDGAHRLTEQETNELLAFGEQLVSATAAENLDLPILSLVSRKLLGDTQAAQNRSAYIKLLDVRMDTCYAMMNLMGRVTAYPDIANRYRREGLEIGRQICQFLAHGPFESLDVESRGIVLTDARYMAVFYEGTTAEQYPLNAQLDLLEARLALSEDPFYHALVPGFDWDYYRYRALNYYAKMTDLGNARGFGPDQLEKICRRTEAFVEFWRGNVDRFSKYDNEKQVMMLLYRNRYLAGRIGLDEYRAELMTLYEQRDPDQYDLNGVYDNLQIPLEAFSVLSSGLIPEGDRAYFRDIYRNMLLYAFHMPNNGSLSTLLEYYIAIINRFIEIPGGITFEDMVLQCLAALHPPTYIHSVMVAKLSDCLCDHLIDSRPELLVGVNGCGCAEEVVERRAELRDFVYHAGLCHDFGKLSIIDTIFVYGRDLLDMEFELIKAHPRSGYEMLKQYDSTRPYADIALGHHRWYDNSWGYPEDFDAGKSPLKAVIDLVTCADCMDAATDSVGRSYKHYKTLDDFIGEIRSGSGTRYAPWLLEQLTAPDTYRDLAAILEDGRRETYNNTYYLLRRMCDVDLS